jgi:tetratricopeptide (TPR) repeat protein
MYEAQAQLADAYLEVGRGLEARIISEDLVAREPWNRANIERFRRALVMLGEGDPDAIIAERLSGESPFLATDKLDLNEGFVFDDDAAAAPPPPRAAEPPQSPPPAPAPAPAAPAAKAKGKVKATPKADEEEEVDLDALDAKLSPPPPAPAADSGRHRSADQLFRQKREEAGRGSLEEAAAEQYRLALTYKELGMEDEAMKALEAAARSPRHRFDAASLLGHLFLERGDHGRSIEWFERAAEAPAPTPELGRELLYDLADTLETSGEHARALAVFVELEAESGGFRDVAKRIERLSKVRAKG